MLDTFNCVAIHLFNKTQLIKYLKKYPFSVLWTIVLFTLSLYPRLELPSTGGIELDKIAHWGFYFIYTLIVAFETLKQYLKIEKRLVFISAIAFCFLIGFFIELLQGFCVPGRVFDGFDLLANLIGACSAFIFFPLFKSK